MTLQFSRALGALVLGASCALFAGCASVRPANDLFAGAQDNDTTITRYQGRFSARYTQGNAEQSAVGSFLWRERGTDVQLELMSPLGQTLARMKRPGVDVFVRFKERFDQASKAAGKEQYQEAVKCLVVFTHTVEDLIEVEVDNNSNDHRNNEVLLVERKS